MEVEVDVKDNSLMIVPETDFEEQWLAQFMCSGVKGFVKCGLSPATIIGLKIYEDPWR